MNATKLKLMRAIVLAFKEDENFNGVWPEPATSLTQQGNSYVEFDEEVDMSYTISWGAEKGQRRENFCTCYEDLEGLPYGDYEWDSGETITKEEYNAYLAANPNWYEELQAAKQRNVGRIAELNKQIGTLINEMTALADEAGVELNIDLGQHGSLDPNSDWNDSRC